MSERYGTEPVFRVAPAVEYPHEREPGRRRPHGHPYAQAPEPPPRREAGDLASVLGLPADAVPPQMVDALSGILAEIERLRFHHDQAEYRLRHLERQSDSHTIVPALNRRGFMRELESFLMGGEAEGFLAVLHVGGIEALSGLHGLVAGEGALRHVCAAILQELRSSDLVACIGGSDFAVLMPGCGEEDAANKLDAITRRINDPAFTWMGMPESLPVHWGGHVLGKGEGAEQAVAAADRRRRGLEG